MRRSHLRVIAAQDEIGDSHAPVGTRRWALAIRIELTQMWKESTTTLARLRDALQVFAEAKGYQQLDDAFGHPFPSMRAFCIAMPPHGLGYDPLILEALQRELRQITLGEWMAEIQPLQEHGTNQHTAHEDLIIIKSSAAGPDTRYKIARLKRDHPAIAEALSRGEYRSVHAACKAAGFVHDESPLTTLHRVWRKVAPEDRLRFLIEMLTLNERRALQFGFEDEEQPHA